MIIQKSKISLFLSNLKVFASQVTPVFRDGSLFAMVPPVRQSK
ncbi:hypothetical protein CLOSTMETH_01721 [[Clostridium] methylpentosum DSM 5476]|uniref:Uncharacterized protein n=1 Tax=[Clostridium] methylpentosum DSM 5476 TaxID=537013 RepID=C0ED00_9FIRM|nr:hypothetical protein CLOSTMETH_01721 [[Clostridium] methylpentosum DSM 5476]